MPGNHLPDQIYKTFAGCGVANSETPRASTGYDLERVLKENHLYVFSLIHKFNKDVDPNATAFFEKMSNQSRDDQNRCLREIERHQEANKCYRTRACSFWN